ncbi:Imm8 family immunity protein [Paracoccus sp. CPCC 101403]|uniref:Imm8 family immunity protein n=1 Tax=Paracoccus broussonetiae TaxID=3075834 RepID=A0ABU3EKC6_9RHOB|nr:Imm8 family immunity protein [Paracoccus sp. CPCC 101403]MDT1064707.1 Imm8 family immunity protein [Paracoccus sp. CPCC 101403]
MEAEIKSFFLGDFHGEPLCPSDPKHFGGILDLVIGETGSTTGDNFSVFVCTPSWFSASVLKVYPTDPTHEAFSKPAFGRHHPFVSMFDEKEVRGVIDKLLGNEARGDWSKPTARLARNLPWEFEDYQG